ncbi:dNA-binding helix-turn-helix protein [Megasphaera elsdenii CAG:570]|mgnify:CR=1 FL=1|uniref:DNA-binding helix-turn-helix protein n=1 Tax=Megasphaera elsdenii CAG:570 TaxID=1263087 RepID=R7MYI6_MEGEL|nr:dNA-binding helix-turn-helix protein [Megasphaera elsdenii CAG:570]
MPKVNLEFIKKRRKELHITQAEMATALGLSSSSGYNHYENGNRRFTANIMPMMAKILKCSIENLYT